MSELKGNVATAVPASHPGRSELKRLEGRPAASGDQK
jgi:hypothetical protein